MPLKIAYLTSKDPRDKRQSSGVYYYQTKALMDSGAEIEYLGPVNNRLIFIITKLSKLLSLVIKKKYNPGHSILVSKVYGKIFSRKLRKGQYDLVFADKASNEIAYLKTEIPLVYSTDGTFKLLNNYYPNLSNLLDVSVREGNLIEQRAINNADMVLCASTWAAESVIKDYGKQADKVHVIPRGANIDRLPSNEKIRGKKKGEKIRLLYMGAECYRKGYDIAYKTMSYIRKLDIPVQLTAVGCRPPEKFMDSDVEVIRYVNKNNPEGMKQFEELMFGSDFYLLPTRAECMGIAFCESSAYGLPAITRDTGGVTEVVKDGINGYALPFESTPDDFGEKIIEIFRSEKEYYDLIENSRRYFEERLNWDAWSRKVMNLIKRYADQSLTENGDQRNTRGTKSNLAV